MQAVFSIMNMHTCALGYHTSKLLNWDVETATLPSLCPQTLRLKAWGGGPCVFFCRSPPSTCRVCLFACSAARWDRVRCRALTSPDLAPWVRAHRRLPFPPLCSSHTSTLVWGRCCRGLYVADIGPVAPLFEEDFEKKVILTLYSQL